jgi:hypothetical protein
MIPIPQAKLPETIYLVKGYGRKKIGFCLLPKLEGLSNLFDELSSLIKSFSFQNFLRILCFQLEHKIVASPYLESSGKADIKRRK